METERDLIRIHGERAEKAIQWALRSGLGRPTDNSEEEYEFTPAEVRQIEGRM